MDAVTTVPTPANEPVLQYAPGSPERAEVQAALAELTKEPLELTATIGGEQRMGGGPRIDVVQPHNHRAVLGVLGSATQQDTRDALAAAREAAPAWRKLSFDDRAAILLRAADLLTGPWRAKLNAATMLGQSKTVHQAEIDAACELADFWRFNVAFARRLLAEQPASSPRRLEPHRPPAAGGVRLRDHPVQLHRDRGQPAHRARADGQRRAVETLPHAELRRAPDDAAARRSRPAAGCDQPAAR